MKITSGKYKYRKLDLPNGIRPTTEKVREAVFSMIAPWLEDAVVMDMFAGSGAYGLEALSRGAAHCYFSETSRATSRILISNIEGCEAGEFATVYNSDYQTAIKRVSEQGLTLEIVLDPPYNELPYYDKAMELLQIEGLLDEGSLVVAEHLYDNRLSDKYGSLKKIKEKRYGSIGVDIYIYEKEGQDDF
ncbi:MAG: 16S rRNA (guanine(966)-N(2))-methyltransferase RsmD [Mogibacterium sp.]|nr:16S rRNA (guanine(966)-N(2))-methyltransferase RsmD [Mogibacterium sp.]